MNFRQLTVVMAMSAVVATSAAHAASSADYLAAREKTTVTTLQTTNELMQQYASHAGQVIELDGVVSDIAPYGQHEAFLLHIDAQQNVRVAAPQDDADIVAGAKLQVLARVPANGDVLEALSVTKAEQGQSEQAATPPANDAQAPLLAKSAVDIATVTPEASPLTKAETDVTDVKAVNVADVTQESTGSAAMPAATRRRHHSRRTARHQQGAARVAAKSTRTFSQKVQLYASRIRSFNHSISAATATAIATHVLLSPREGLMRIAGNVVAMLSIETRESR